MEHRARGNEKFDSLSYKRATFREEWRKMYDDSLCHREMLRIFGTCDTPHVVADVVERVLTYDVIEQVMSEGMWKKEWWCWPLRWIMDILDVLAFAEDTSKHPLITFHPHFYSHLNEFGVTSSSAILKVISFALFFQKQATHVHNPATRFGSI